MNDMEVDLKNCKISNNLSNSLRPLHIRDLDENINFIAIRGS